MAITDNICLLKSMPSILRFNHNNVKMIEQGIMGILDILFLFANYFPKN